MWSLPRDKTQKAYLITSTFNEKLEDLGLLSATLKLVSVGESYMPYVERHR